MANNILDVLLKTIGTVQKKNAASKKEPTAHPSVFDLIKSKLQNLDQKNKGGTSSRAKTPKSIFDMIKKEINGAKRENKKDPNVETAPGSIFDNILKKVDESSKRQANTGIKNIINEYNLDVRKLPADVLQQIHEKYMQDKKDFDKQYAQAIFDLTKKY